MEEEIWKDVIGCEGLYQVSNHGRVKSLNYHRMGIAKILKPKKHGKYNHLHVDLRNNGQRKDCFVHRLVLTSFVGCCPEGKECLHLDGNASNNRLENLRWGTHAENMRDMINHGRSKKGNKYHSKLNEPLVCKIRQLSKEGRSYRDD